MATSAFQIEGAPAEDGKGESIWDRFAADGRMTVSGDPACDHYHRLDEDLDLLADLGVDAYRFSISWPRVIPDGVGDVNEPGIAFYERLVDGLRARGIAPLATLYHWDLPQALQERGGWASRDTTESFARYATVVGQRLGDRVAAWITHNEPWVATFLGHMYGAFAPGISDWDTALRVGHHILLSHGLATNRLREVGADRIGIALDCRPARPASASPGDAAAARHFDGFRNRWFFDPVFGRGYPQDMVSAYESRGRVPLSEFVVDGDLDEISGPIDFLGLNYYTTLPVSAGAEEEDDPEVEPGPGVPEGYTEMGWAIDPRGLEEYLVEITDAYSPPEIVITENGASYSDGPDDAGRIADDRRIGYLRSHVAAVDRARARGVPVTGYCVWSLLDNLEWTQGFDQRFGLVWVDHTSQQRLRKDSFYWYRDEIRRRRRSLR